MDPFCETFSFITMKIPVKTAIISPARKPPPIRRLMMAAGKTINADSNLPPNEYAIAPMSITNPRITPRMKPRLPS